MIECSFKTAEALNEFDRTLVADSRCAGNVVNRISAQRHHVHHTRRRYAEYFFYFRSIADQVVLGRIQHVHAVVDQLQHVRVAGNHVHVAVFDDSLGSECADYVIRFITRHFKNRNAICYQSLSNVWNLLRQVSRHFRAVCLVFLILLIAKCGRCHVEHRSKVFRRKVVAQLAQHIHKNVDRCRRQAFARGHSPLSRHCMIGPEDE